ncbi:flagellar type III secretion system protein FlhB [Desulfonatronum sp. SC1]|uniref:flagellar type III secretion system protein FlhB n=1 Tax=Desulfonatronum sp. SC1 TaxID=2109626 RepID=UPI000D2FE7EF|nr:flagellar type III secretion system protein FlhB [Desulfonatronum sp. SC1]PTN37040.1 flagellar biosynthesis protein FlhB [Desulfonatronum sp. SC1]
MPQSDPSKTEQATPKQRDKAREKGNVPKSQELPKVTVLLGGFLALLFMVQIMVNQMHDLFIWTFSDNLLTEFTPETVYLLFQTVSWRIAVMVLPVMFTCALVAFLTVRLQVGHLWTLKVFELSNFWKKLDIVAGIQRLLISTQTVVRLLRSLGMAIAVGFAPYLVLKMESPNFIPLFYQDALYVAAYMLTTGAKMVMYALVPMLIISIADLAYTRWDYEENLKMTKDEVKDERKQAEGDQAIKNKQRQKMLAVMQKRMMESVPKADVVITNPTHLAIALRYNPLEAPSPMVLAKGADFMAAKIRDIAQEHNIPIRENKPLAQALYKSVDVGQAIPEELFQAVASILAQLPKFRRR